MGQGCFITTKYITKTKIHEFRGFAQKHNTTNRNSPKVFGVSHAWKQTNRHVIKLT